MSDAKHRSELPEVKAAIHELLEGEGSFEMSRSRCGRCVAFVFVRTPHVGPETTAEQAALHALAMLRVSRLHNSTSDPSRS